MINPASRQVNSLRLTSLLLKWLLVLFESEDCRLSQLFTLSMKCCILNELLMEKYQQISSLPLHLHCAESVAYWCKMAYIYPMFWRTRGSKIALRILAYFLRWFFKNKDNQLWYCPRSAAASINCGWCKVSTDCFTALTFSPCLFMIDAPVPFCTTFSSFLRTQSEDLKKSSYRLPRYVDISLVFK